MDLERRQLFDGGLSLGALTLLTGCDVSDHDSVQRALAMMSRFNDRVQAAIFGPNKLAPTFSEGEAVKHFRYNAWYGKDKAPKLSAADYRLQLAGQIADKQPWTVEKLYRLPQVTQITRHVCVEGWSMIGKWSGPPLSAFLQRIGRRCLGKICWFRVCGWLLRGHRHAHRVAPADADGIQTVR